MKSLRLTIALLAALALLPAACLADPDRLDGDITDATGRWKYSLGEGGATITYILEWAEDEVTVPREVDGHPVVAIGDWAFHLCDGIAGVTIPDGVSSIGEGAFMGCTGLRRASLPNGLMSIGANAFTDCYELRGIALPRTLASIGELAFDCAGLEGVYVPPSAADIGEDAFGGCEMSELRGEAGSRAEAYAEESGMGFAAEAYGGGEALALASGAKYVFSSGVGGWSNEISVGAGGEFEGYFHDTDMGDGGDGYPNGTMYERRYRGRLEPVGRVDDNTYEFRAALMEADGELGDERIEGGVRIIIAPAFGLELGDALVFYAEGSETDYMPLAFSDWMCMPNGWEEIPPELPFRALYNATQGFGFGAY